MAFLEWRDKMSVGNETLDNDHRKLLDFINDLHDLMSGYPEPERVERLLDQLVDYAEYSFHFEEKLLRLCKFPGYETHKKMHDDLIAQCRKIRETYHERPSDFQLVTTFDFLSNWLMKHLLREDVSYRPYLERKT